MTIKLNEIIKNKLRVTNFLAAEITLVSTALKTMFCSIVFIQRMTITYTTITGKYF